jgi:hypothetical protein
MENFARGMNHPPTVFFHPKGTSGQAFRFDDKSYPGGWRIPARLKPQGMRWTGQGARNMAFLRADLFNGEWGNTTRASLAA